MCVDNLQGTSKNILIESESFVVVCDKQSIKAKLVSIFKRSFWPLLFDLKRHPDTGIASVSDDLVMRHVHVQMRLQITLDINKHASGLFYKAGSVKPLS